MITTDTIAWQSTPTTAGYVLLRPKERKAWTRSTLDVHCAIRTYALGTAKMAVKTSTALYRP